MRIISICPSNTELIGYLGLTEQLVAVDDYSDWPMEVNQLPRLGPDLQIDMDRLQSFEPDLVLASLSVPGMERNIEELQKRNIPHLVLNPNTLDEIAEDLLLVGQYTKCELRAQQLVKRFKQIIFDYKTLAKDVKKTTVYWEWWPKPVFTPGKQNWLTEISQLAGGVNIFDTENIASVQTDWDDVYKRNPEHICLVWVGVQTNKVNPAVVYKRPNWTTLQAIEKNNIYILEEPLFCRPSPRLLIGLKKIAAILHPNIFPPFDEIDPLFHENTHK
ncbi:cobalamin-binding protein [Alkalihalobacillus sp. LMS39]|uniref:cobalamin-binding protein n=1 Tax=Alkalihalobacillus sp. LMS39 TaxID=2924032 RepID=UPI001FB5523F|nr:cobalamin-binding protein [Alkalihalobacillus sp. LMS39]UOE93646.1 cobalamin-binding protein [Alkalihalobacillus sp. LMS39]